MDLIPAIDIIKGQCVRLSRGDFNLKKIYNDSPLKLAKAFQKLGFLKIHLIDLDGAKEGKIKNWEAINKIAKNTDLLIEFGGGVRDEGDINRLLKLGVDKIILGSLVVKEPERFREIIKKFGEKIIVGLDSKKGKIYYKGWQEKSGEELFSFLKKLNDIGVKNFLCTDISRDGMLRGPNFSLYKKLLKLFPKVKIIAAGGISSKKDLEKLSKIGVAGVTAGKAIYENKISLKELKSFL